MLPSPQQRLLPSRLTCMGLGPAPFCTPPPARGLDLPPLTGQPPGSMAVLDPGSLCLSVLHGAGWGCREPGCPPLSVKKDRLPRAGLRLALCVLGGDSSGRDEQDSMVFQSVCEKKLPFGGCKVLVSDVKNWWGGKFGCVAVRPISWACYLPGKVLRRFPPAQGQHSRRARGISFGAGRKGAYPRAPNLNACLEQPSYHLRKGHCGPSDTPV